MTRSLVIDTNLLVLLVVGSIDRAAITSHRRLRGIFVPNDIRRLTDYLMLFQSVVVTPNTLTEADNLLGGGNDPISSRHRKALALFSRRTIEIYTPSRRVVDEPEFAWLGLADTAQLIAASDLSNLLTIDGMLHTAALRRGVRAIHFRELPDSLGKRDA